MSGIFVPKRTAEIKDIGWGVCLWKLSGGGLIMDSDGNYLSAQGRTCDPVVEAKMRSAAASLGVLDGSPQWMPGFRKISDSEHDDQMEMLMNGENPDPVDVYRQISGQV